MIKLINLTKYYKKHARGILDVSLEIKPGEIFGFIGPNELVNQQQLELCSILYFLRVEVLQLMD